MYLAAGDVRAANWLVASLTTFAASVISLVPAGFDAYVRIFHPALRRGAPLRWEEIASITGLTMHPGVQPPFTHHARPGVYDRAPLEGTLPRDLVPVLVPPLGAHTAADTCWFAVWDGFGGLRDDVRSAPAFELPKRRYHLLRGPLGSLGESACAEPGWQSANIWWPDDRTWCAATEIDLHSTYVGCTIPCRDALLASPGLECLEIDPAAGIHFGSDAVNPASS